MKNLEKYIDNINYIREKINPLQMIITSSSINSRKELRNGIIVAIIVNSEDEINEYEDFASVYRLFEKQRKYLYSNMEKDKPKNNNKPKYREMDDIDFGY